MAVAGVVPLHTSFACMCAVGFLATARAAPAVQAHWNAQQHSDEFVMDLLVSLDKLSMLVQELLVIEVGSLAQAAAALRKTKSSDMSVRPCKESGVKQRTLTGVQHTSAKHSPAQQQCQTPEVPSAKLATTPLLVRACTHPLYVFCCPGLEGAVVPPLEAALGRAC